MPGGEGAQDQEVESQLDGGGGGAEDSRARQEREGVHEPSSQEKLDGTSVPREQGVFGPCIEGNAFAKLDASAMAVHLGTVQRPGGSLDAVVCRKRGVASPGSQNAVGRGAASVVVHKGKGHKACQNARVSVQSGQDRKACQNSNWTHQHKQQGRGVEEKDKLAPEQVTARPAFFFPRPPGAPSSRGVRPPGASAGAATPWRGGPPRGASPAPPPRPAGAIAGPPGQIRASLGAAHSTPPLLAALAANAASRQEAMLAHPWASGSLWAQQNPPPHHLQLPSSSCGGFRHPGAPQATAPAQRLALLRLGRRPSGASAGAALCRGGGDDGEAGGVMWRCHSGP